MLNNNQGMIWGADAIEIMILTFLLPILAEEWDLNTGEDGTIGAVVFAGMLIGGLTLNARFQNNTQRCMNIQQYSGHK